jgi:hypothetical protein
MTLTNTIATWQQAELVRLLKNAPGTQYQESDDANRTIMRDWVRSLLQKQPITVTFVKADGTDREMLCTLNGDYIPTTAVPVVPVDGIVSESKRPRKDSKEPDPAVIKVYDIEAKSWRSFRMDRLKKITAELNFQ